MTNMFNMDEARDRMGPNNEFGERTKNCTAWEPNPLNAT